MTIRIATWSGFILLSSGAWCPAQRACPRGEDAKMYYYNTSSGGPVGYPHFQQPGGTVNGDCAWKVFPAEWFLRATRDVTPFNIRIVVNVANNDPLVPVTFCHRAEIRWALRDARGWLIPDFVRAPLAVTPAPNRVTIPHGGNWIYQPPSWNIAVGGFDPWTELGIAAVVYGGPGENPSTTSVGLPNRSRGERYGRSPQPSFSGLRDGTTGQITLLTPPLVPEAAEFQFAIGMQFPSSMVQASATSAIDNPDPNEEFLGIGAYYNDLASRGGRLRLYAEDERPGGTCGPPQIVGLILWSLDRSANTYSVPGLACLSHTDLGDPISYMPLSWGWITSFLARDPCTNLADSYLFTPWIDVPQGASLINARVHFEVFSALLVPGSERIASVSNSYLLTLR